MKIKSVISSPFSSSVSSGNTRVEPVRPITEINPRPPKDVIVFETLSDEASQGDSLQRDEWAIGKDGGEANDAPCRVYGPTGQVYEIA